MQRNVRVAVDLGGVRVGPCPLCSEQDASPVWQVSYDRVWRQLKDQWGIDVPRELRHPWDAAGLATLVACRRCDLEYFSPMIPATGDFYELLSALYVDHRWEFDVVRERLSASDVLIDFGCGRGDFLAGARTRVASAIGCDYNPRVLVGAGSGIEVLPAPFAEAAATRAGTFSVAVSFHVLEHVSDAREILDAARIALRPGGRLFLSTPDRDRTARARFEVFDCPPHHVSRWSGAQFRRLAEVHGWELVGVDHEPFVHRTGRRRLVPTSALYAAGWLKHAARGSAQRPRGMRVGTAAGRWPRGLAVLAELRLP